MIAPTIEEQARAAMAYDYVSLDAIHSLISELLSDFPEPCEELNLLLDLDKSIATLPHRRISAIWNLTDN
jgi:hypothetical protein